MNRKLIIIRGTSGSGKSTLAAELYQSFYSQNIPVEHFETDRYFVNSDGIYNFDYSKLGSYHSLCQSDTKKALEDDKVVIVSNTFTTLRELKSYFLIAQKLNIIPIVYHCQNEFKDIHNVPEEVLINQKKRFQYDISSLFEIFN